MKRRSLIFFSLFSLGVVALYFLFVELYMPELRPVPPPKEEVFDIALISEEEFVAFGERIFTGKGSCRLCHKGLGGRAPSLDEIFFVAEDRLAETAYKGRARTATEYILESMLEPGLYVVEGYGKTEQGRVVSPMPRVTSGLVNLNPLEIRAVVAYLQRSSGVEVSIKPSLVMPGFAMEKDRDEDRGGK